MTISIYIFRLQADVPVLVASHWLLPAAIAITGQ